MHAPIKLDANIRKNLDIFLLKVNKIPRSPFIVKSSQNGKNEFKQRRIHHELQHRFYIWDYFPFSTSFFVDFELKKKF